MMVRFIVNMGQHSISEPETIRASSLPTSRPDVVGGLQILAGDPSTSLTSTSVPCIGLQVIVCREPIWKVCQRLIDVAHI